LSYRERIYRTYRSSFLGFDRRIGGNEIREEARWYGFHFKGFIPSDRNSRIVDVGCGTGTILRWLKQEGYTRLTGVDVSPEQVEAAKDGLDDIVLGEATGFLSTRAEHFDQIIAIDLIEHLTKDELIEFLDACREALRAGGRLLVRTPNLTARGGTALRYGDFTHELGLTPGALNNLFRLTGFHEYRARECVPVPHGLVSASRFLLWHVVRLLPLAYDYIEVGGNNFPVYTRNFIALGIKA
jgi:SAM-dependent methyltransferase